MDVQGDWASSLAPLWALLGHCWNSLYHLDIRRMIVEHGSWFYLITFFWTFVEGETFVIFAASFAAQGLLNPFILLFSAWLGSFSSVIPAGAAASMRRSVSSDATAPASC